MATPTMPMLDTCPQPINLDRRKLAAAIDALIACSGACRSCGDECGSRAETHEHCRIRADACGAREQACRDLLAVMS